MAIQGRSLLLFCLPISQCVIKISLTKKGSRLNNDDIGDANILYHLNILNIGLDDCFVGHMFV